MKRRKLLFMSVFSLLLVELWIFIMLELRGCVCATLFWWERAIEIPVFIIWTLVTLWLFKKEFKL